MHVGQARAYVSCCGCAAACLALQSSACSSSSATGGADAAAVLGVEGDASAPMGVCGAVEQEHRIAGWGHVPVCSHVDYATKPPSSGDHYPIWAAYKSYANAIPEGYFVHDLEHGAIVLSYNCALVTTPPADAGAVADAAAPPDPCAASVAAAQAMIDALPADASCTAQGSSVRTRVVMTPDPRLDAPFAASAWGWTLRAQCFDADVFRAFAIAHEGQGREDTCADGQDLSSGVDPTCGE